MNKKLQIKCWLMAFTLLTALLLKSRERQEEIMENLDKLIDELDAEYDKD